MKSIPFHRLHELLFRTIRPRGTQELAHQGHRYIQKRYDRFPQIALPFLKSPVTLEQALSTRSSVRRPHQHALNQEDIGTILGMSMHISSAENERSYPSGGGKYPIEVYFVCMQSTDLRAGVYHYRPDTHALEHLWDLPENTHIYSVLPCAWLHPRTNPLVSGVFVFTSTWSRNNEPYRQFAYPLALTESGHIAQNILLSASARNLKGVPVSGINHAQMAQLLGVDIAYETPLYSVTFLHDDTP